MFCDWLLLVCISLYRGWSREATAEVGLDQQTCNRRATYRLESTAVLRVVLISDLSQVNSFEALRSPHFSKMLISFSFATGGLFKDTN